MARARLRLLSMPRCVVCMVLFTNGARSTITSWNVTMFGSSGSTSSLAVARYTGVAVKACNRAIANTIENAVPASHRRL